MGTHKGASRLISHAELQRQVLRDDGRNGKKRGKGSRPIPRNQKAPPEPNQANPNRKGGHPISGWPPFVHRSAPVAGTRVSKKYPS